MPGNLSFSIKNDRLFLIDERNKISSILNSLKDGELSVCLLGTRIRSFARHRRKKEKSCFGDEFETSKTAKDRLSPSDASVDSAISDVSSSQEGSLSRQPTW